ncbi:Serine/threonine-protein kinase 4 [Actinomortierella ambigua]|nr:Serine/threonine-protein kinase 4 [Actinomortierella ambigua]
MLATDTSHEPLACSPVSTTFPRPLPTLTSASHTNSHHGLNTNNRRLSSGSLLGLDPTSRFEILERLGYGSSGSIVYKARDLQEDKIIAIKKIPIGLLAAFPGEETTSEDVDYFVSWIVDHCIADEPAMDVGGEDEDMPNGSSHCTNNVPAQTTPASPTTGVNDSDESRLPQGATLPLSAHSNQEDPQSLQQQQQQQQPIGGVAAAAGGGARSRSHSVSSTRSRSGSIGSLKRSSSRRRTGTKSYRQLQEEERLGLERLVRCLGCHRNDTDLWLELEYCPAGSAADLIRLSGGALSENEIGWLISQVLLAVAYLHAKGHVHGDIKAGNMLLTQEGQVKLGGSGVIMNHKEGAGERKRRRRSLTMAEFPASWLAPETSASASSTPATPAAPSSPSGFQQQQQQQYHSSSTPSPLGPTRPRHSSYGEASAQQHGPAEGRPSTGWGSGGVSSNNSNGGGMPEATIEADIWALGVACIELCQGIPPQPQAPILSIAAAVAVAKNAGRNNGGGDDVLSSRAGTPISDESSSTKGDLQNGGRRTCSNSSNSSINSSGNGHGRGSPEGDPSHSITMSASHPSMAISSTSPSFTSIYSPLLEDLGGSSGGGMMTFNNNGIYMSSSGSVLGDDSKRGGDHSHGGVGDLTSRMSPMFWNFVARCLTPEPAARPTVRDLLKDPFIAERAHSKDELLERIQAMQAFVDQCAALTLEPLLEPLSPLKPSIRDTVANGQAHHSASKKPSSKSAVEEGIGAWGSQHHHLCQDEEEQDGPRHPSDLRTEHPDAGKIGSESTASLRNGSTEALRDEAHPPVLHARKTSTNDDDDDEDLGDPLEQRIGSWRVKHMPSRAEITYDASSYFDEAGLPTAPSNLRHENPHEWRNQRLSHPIVKQALMCERAGYITFRHSRSPSLATIVETEEERALERERELERARERQRRELERARLKAAMTAASVLALKKAASATTMATAISNGSSHSVITIPSVSAASGRGEEVDDAEAQARKEEDEEDRRRKNRAESVAAAVAVAAASVVAAAAAAAAASGSDSGSITGSDNGAGAGGGGSAVAAAAAAAAAAAMASPTTATTATTTAQTSPAPNSIQRLRRQSQVERDDASRKAAKERAQKMQQQREREERELLLLREVHGDGDEEDIRAGGKKMVDAMDVVDSARSRHSENVAASRANEIAAIPNKGKQPHGLARSASGGGGVGHFIRGRPLSKVSDDGLGIQVAVGSTSLVASEGKQRKVVVGEDPQEEGKKPMKKRKKLGKAKQKLKKLTNIFSWQWWKGLGRRKSSRGVDNASDAKK